MCVTRDEGSPLRCHRSTRAAAFIGRAGGPGCELQVDQDSVDDLHPRWVAVERLYPTGVLLLFRGGGPDCPGLTYMLRSCNSVYMLPTSFYPCPVA